MGPKQCHEIATPTDLLFWPFNVLEIMLKTSLQLPKKKNGLQQRPK
jgi:hypothetical protein